MRCARIVPTKWSGRSARFFCQGLRYADRLFVHHFQTPQFTLDGSCASKITPLVGCARTDEYGPRHSGYLCGHRDDDLVTMHAAIQAIEPRAEHIPLTVQMSDAGARAVDQQAANIRISSLAYSKERRLPSRGMLPRHKAEPSREITRFGELLPIANRRE